MAKELEHPIIGYYVKPSYCNPYGFPRITRFSCYDTPTPPAYPPGSNPGQPLVTLDFERTGSGVGYCSGNGCNEPTRIVTSYKIKYAIPPYGVPVFRWNVSSGATIVGGGSPVDDYVTIETNSTDDVVFTIYLDVTDKNGTHSFQKDYIHSVRENTSSLWVSEIIESVQGYCRYWAGKTCTAESIFHVSVSSDRAYTIEWTATGGDIVGSSTGSSVKVSTTGDSDSAIHMKVVVSDGITTITKEGDFVQHRYETMGNIHVDGIVETAAGYCEHEPDYPCTATSWYRVDHSGGGGTISYSWSVSSQSGKAYISGSRTNQTVAVSSSGEEDEPFTLTIVLTDSDGVTDTMSRNFMHKRKEVPIVPIEVATIWKSSGEDSCEYRPGETCIATATYAAVLQNATGSVSYKWTAYGASIVGANDGSSVRVSTDDDSDVTFQLKVEVHDVNSSDTYTKDITHHHSQMGHVEIESVSEVSSGSCYYEPNGTCEAESVHKVTYSGENGPVNISWNVVSGDAQIVSGGDTDTVHVTSSGNSDTAFTLGVTVADDIGNDYEEASFTHTRVEDEPIVILDILENSSGSCEHGAGDTCVATSEYEVDYNHETGTVQFDWTVTGATIVSGQGNKVITVETEDDEDVTFTVEVEITDDNSSDTMSKQFTHHRTEVSGVQIDSIEETQAGSCYYLTGNTCTATSMHKVYTSNAHGELTYSWSISGDATIVSGSDTDEVTVQSTGDADANFTLTVMVEDDIHQVGDSADFTHTRTEDTEEIYIDYIEETETGECDYEGGGECTATSRYEAVIGGATGAVEYEWRIVSGDATLVSSPSESYAEVRSTGDTDIEFELEVCVQDADSSACYSEYFTHTRTEVGSGPSEPKSCSSDPFGDMSVYAVWYFDNSPKSNSWMGTWHGTEAYSPCKFKNGADFDGSSYIDVSSEIRDGYVPDEDGGISISYFVKTKAGNSAPAAHLSTGVHEDAGYTNGIAITYEDDNTIAANFGDNSTWVAIVHDYGESIVDKVVHVCFVYSNSDNTGRLYIDGEFVGDQNCNLVFDENSNDIIGQIAASEGTNFAGVIDQLYVFGRPLTSDEVLLLSDMSDPHTADDIDPLGDSSEVAFYKFEDDAADEYGSYDGTWSGEEQYEALVFGQGAKLGGSSHLSVPAQTINQGSAFSVSFWARVDSPVAWGWVIGLKKEKADNHDNGIFVYVNDNSELKFGANEIDGDVVGGGSVFLKSAVGDIFHFVITAYNDGSDTYIQAYENGLSIFSESGDVDISQLNQFVFGDSLDNASTHEMPISLDQVRVFNKELSQDEVRCLYYEQERDYVLVDDIDPFGDGSCYILYLLDGDTIDECGNVDAAWVGTEQYTDGKFFQAAQFSGEDGIGVRIFGKSDTEDWLVSDWTVSLWTKPHASGGGEVFSFARSHSSTSYPDEIAGAGIHWNGDPDYKFTAFSWTTTDPYWYEESYTVGSGVCDRWTHLVYVHDFTNRVAKMYVDGTLRATVNFSGQRGTYDHVATLIGAGADGDSEEHVKYGYGGIVDQFRLFDRVLTDEEVQMLAKEQESDDT